MEKFKVGDKVECKASGLRAAVTDTRDQCKSEIKVEFEDGSGSWRDANHFTLIPDTPSWLPLEVGKEYRLRNGMKYKFLARSQHKSYCLIGEYYCHDDKEWYGMYHRDGGFFHTGGESHLDIIGPWIEKPTMDFSVLPAWWKSIAMGPSGIWYWSSKVFVKGCDCWLCSEFQSSIIPPEYCPKWTGDWQDSLVIKED